MGEPTREEVLGWMARTGRSAAEAVDHFWPGASLEQRRAHQSTVRSWKHRAEKGSTPRSPNRPKASGDQDEEQRPDPDYATARLDDVAFGEWMLAELVTDLRVARARGDTRSIASLNAQASDARDRLVAARFAAGEDGDMDETPEAIARKMLDRQRELQLLQEAGERREAPERRDRHL